jgi:hypothetical protein
LKNAYEVDGKNIYIYINRKNGEVLKTVIDKEFFHKVNSFSGNWLSRKCSNTGKFYVQGRVKDGVISLHRYITNCADGLVVDHVNGDTLDNRINNLREVTTAQNSQNRQGLDLRNTSGYRNVYFVKKRNRYKVMIGLDGKYHSFGYYSDIEEANEVAIKARRELLPYSTK